MDQIYGKYIFKFSHKYLFWIIMGAVLSIICVVCNITIADILSKIIDESIKSSNALSLNHLLIAGIIFIIGIISNYGMVFCTGYYGSKIMQDIKNATIEHLTKLPANYMGKNNIGDLIAKMTNDAESLQQFMEDSFSDAIYTCVAVIGCSIYMCYVNWKLFFACLGILIILIPISIISMKPVKLRSKQYVKMMGKTNNNIQDVIRVIRIVKSYNLEDQVYNKYKEKLDEALEFALMNDKKQYAVEPVSYMIMNLPIIICLVYGGYIALNGEISLGTVAAFLTLLKLIIQPLYRGYLIYINSKSALASAERVFSILNTETELVIKNSEVLVEFDRDTVFAIKDLVFSYNNENNVLKNVTFNIIKGEETALVGRSGSGKSSLIKLLCKFYNVHKGYIYFNGVDINNLDINYLREQISYVSQDSYLFPVSILNNIKVGKENATREEIIEAAKLANAHDFIINLPQGYDTVVGEWGVSLSGGQIQRISVARALLKNSPVLILDEATSALDTDTEVQLKEAIDNLKESKTIISIAHRLSTIKDAEQIVVLDNGQVIEKGVHEELIKKGGSYAKFYELNNIGNRLGGSINEI